MIARMNIRLGIQFRALRVHRELRQDDVGRLARLGRSLISRIERGLMDNIRLGDLERAAAALGGRLDVRLRWQGEELDRLLDAAHAALVDAMVSLLRRLGWEVAVEVSFSIWGERGSIDILAFHQRSGVLLVVEVKSVVPDTQAMLMAIDRKARLAPALARERGWEVAHVARLLVVGDAATARRRIARHAATYSTALPARGREVRRWLRAPVASLSGLLFLPYAPRGSTGRGRPARVRVRIGARRHAASPVARNAPAESV